MIKKINYNQGFSLIEMIVALGIFSIVVTTAVGSLIVVISNNQKLQAEQSAMTNLAFALDSMTREIRMGYAYVCSGVANTNTPVEGFKIFKEDESDESKKHGSMTDSVTKDCGSDDNTTGKDYRGISFVEGGESLSDGASNNRILYYYDVANKKIMRRVGNGKAESIMSSGIDITNARFYVTGSDTLKKNGTNTEQPTVTIQIEAESSSNVTGKPYYLQTTIAQRTLDI